MALTAMLASAQAPAAATARPDGAVRVPILLYHRFGAEARDEMTVRTRTFAWQLRYLETRGYRVIRLRDYVRYRLGVAPAPPPRSVVITADDGRRSVYSDMLPLVRAYHVPVTLFVYPSAISNAPYAMTWMQLARLVRTGLFDVESHTDWHPNFRIERRRLSPQQYREFVRSQLLRSKAILEQRLGVRVEMLAWPFGICDAELMRQASQAGYVAAFTLERRSAGPGDPILALPRELVTDRDVGAAFAQLLTRSSGDTSGLRKRSSTRPPPPAPQRRVPAHSCCVRRTT
jgi:peptidoglycan/xylan/chitin deacetylase (PgdA/CDA1 family)